LLTRFIFLSCLFFFISSLQAQDTLQYNLSYLEDKTNMLSFNEVQDKPFIQHHKGVQSFGIVNTAHWFKLVIKPTQEQLSLNWWVKIYYPPLDYIDYYLLDNEGKLLTTVHSGELRPFEAREVSDPNFIQHLPFSQAKEHTLYIRIQTEGALQVPISLIDSRTLLQEQYLPIMIAGIYYGLFFIIALYSSVILLYTRDKNYLYYLMFVTTFAFWQLSLDGVGVAYIWGNYPWLVEHASALATSMLTFSAIIFSRNFLHTSRYIPKMDIFLKYLMYFCLALTLAATIAPYHYVIKIDGLLSILAPISLFITGILVFEKGYRPARFYILGWFAFLIGCILFSLNKFNIIGGFHFMNHAQQIGSAIEMIMLSWALGDRVKSMQDRYLQKATNLNVILKRRLKKGLEVERQKDKIMIQQSRFAALGEMIEQIAHQWRQPLNTLALINQDLYFKFKLQKFSPHTFDEAHDKIDESLQYMSQTIDDFRNFYTNSSEAETYALKDVIDSALSLSESILNYAKINVMVESDEDAYVHNIKNECVQVCMNILKNAHDALVENRTEDRQITIKIYSRDKEVHLIIEDNAGGIHQEIIDKVFEPYFTTKKSSNGTGIGLYMSKSILQDHLNGTIAIENTAKGARFIITLPQVNKDYLA